MTSLPNGRAEAPTNADGSLKMDDDWVPPPNFPKMVIQTLVEYNGKTWLVTFNDTSIDTAALAIERRGGQVLGMGAASPNAPAAAAMPASSPPTCQNRNCSKFGELMEPSNHGTGYYCKGKDPTTGNQKGYCKSSTK